MFKRSLNLCIMLFAFVFLSGAIKSVYADDANSFDFDDGTLQGWTLQGAYDENGNGPFSSNFLFGWKDYVNYPNPPGGDPPGDHQGSVQLFTMAGHGINNPGATWWIMQFHSPDLSSSSTWQTAKGYSVQIAECMAVMTSLSANLYVKVYDIDQDKDRYFYNGTAQELQHDIYGDDIANWNHLTFDWSEISAFPTNYIVKEVFVNIWGKMSAGFEGGVYLDEVIPLQEVAMYYEDIAELLSAGTTRGTAAKGNYAYALTREGNLNTFDVSDILNLSSFETYKPIGSPLMIGKGGGLLTYQDYLYAYGSGITVVNIQNPASPSIVSSIGTLGTVYNMTLSGSYLVACEKNYVEVFSLTTPSAPSKIGELFIGTEGWSAAVYGDYLYFAGGWSNPMFYIIDFSDPADLSLFNSMPLDDLPYHIKVSDNHLITSCSSSAQLWSLSDPLNPSKLDSISVKGRVCAQESQNLIFNGTVLSVDNSALNLVQTFDTHTGGQVDGFPYGSDVTYIQNHSIIFLAQDQRVLVLRSIVAFPCKGDFDHDGDVDGLDLAVFADAYVTEDPKADLNKDGEVNEEDLAIFAADFGRTDCPITVALNSTSGLDGFVTFTGSAVTWSQAMIGDSSANIAVRGFLSFDISSIPLSADIISATLRAYQEAVNGTPYADLGNVIVDHLDYGPTLDGTDYDLAALQSNVGTLSNNAAIEYKTLDVTARVEADINDGRARSQYRLLFPIPTDSDSLRDAAFFTSANCCTNNFPELVVTYQVPTAP